MQKLLEFFNENSLNLNCILKETKQTKDNFLNSNLSQAKSVKQTENFKNYSHG